MKILILSSFLHTWEKNENEEEVLEFDLFLGGGTCLFIENVSH